MRLFDLACCRGNLLTIITCRRLRALELETIRELGNCRYQGTVWTKAR